MTGGSSAAAARWRGRWFAGYRGAFLLLLLLQAAYFSGVLFRGEVIFPHDNGLEVGCGQEATGSRPHNRKFSDASSVYLPELNQQLNGDHRAWLSTWNPHVQLGRPVFQLSGLSRVWPVTHLFSLFSRDPFRVYSILTVLAVVLTGAFLFMFLRAAGLHPLACLAGGAGLSMGVFVSYWLTFPMFIWTLCWTVFLLWMGEALSAGFSLRWVPAIGFGVYSLVLTGYPQFIILNGYLLAAFYLFRLGRGGGAGEANRWKGFLAAACGVLLGLCAALPVLVDLWETASRSARLGVDDAFFLAISPELDGFSATVAYLGRFFDAFWAGNPIDPSYPLPFEGISLGPLFGFLLLLGAVSCRLKRTGLWLAFILLCVATEVWTPAYHFAVKHLGFHFSRLHLLGGALLPACVVAALGVDRVLSEGTGRIALACCTVLAALAVLAGPLHDPGAAQWPIAALGGAFLLGGALFGWTRRSSLLLVLVAAGVLFYGKSLILSRPPGEISLASPLVESVRALLAPGERYAKAGSLWVLPSNQEALLGIRSVHSYDSLSSRRYQEWAAGCSESGAALHGRHFDRLDDGETLDDPGLSCAGVGCLLAPRDLESSAYEKMGEVCGIRLYRRREPLRLCARSEDFRLSGDGREASMECGAPGVRAEGVEILTDQDDFKEIAFTPVDRPSLLFLSQQYHPRWCARSPAGDLRALPVNGFYQGVLVPAGVGRVTLAFRPAVLWGWVPQVFFLGAAVFFVVAGFRREAGG